MLKISIILVNIGLMTSLISSDGVNNKDENVILDSLEDIETLTYFLLWKYDYFQTNNNVEHSDFESDLEDRTESKLRLFIENLKHNKMIQHITNSSSSLSIDNTIKSCANIDSKFSASSPAIQSPYKLKSLCEAASGCKSASQLMALIGGAPNSKTTDIMTDKKVLTLSQAVVRLCPLMLFQLQEEKCIKQRESQHKAKNRPPNGAVWGFSILFVTIVSFCSLIGVAILPLLTKKTYDTMLTLFTGLAVGSLVGSALFHLIPQAYGLNEDGSHDFLWKALIIFGGIYLFFCSERLMKIVMEFRRKRRSKEMPIPSCTSNDIEPSKLNPQKQVYIKDSDTVNGIIKDSSTPFSIYNKDGLSNTLHFELQNEKNTQMSALQLTDLNEENTRCEALILNTVLERSNSFNKKHGHSHASDQLRNGGEIATVAWMIILGDGLHNFIDGIAIGAAFSQSILEGISISVAVICEEFPHELGDFAVLIASGMTMRQALGYNFISACTCYLGMIFGIFLGDLADGSPYVFALAGGMFLYISLVDMMGELSSALEEASHKGMSQTFKVLFLQNVGILVGVSLLLFLAKYGEKINFEGLAPPAPSDIPFTES